MDANKKARLTALRKRLGKASAVTGGIAAVITPLILMVVEVYPEVQKAKDAANERSKESYEAVMPAIVEMQGIMKNNKKWADNTDEDIKTLSKGQLDMEKRLIRCEVYMDMLSRRGRMPRPPAVDSDAVTSIVKTTKPPSDDRPKVTQEVPQYKLPKSADDARAKAKNRKKLNCPPQDPLCGELE